MKIVSINNLKPGMVISEDVFSYHGQCLAKQNTPVTLQLIEHLKFYQIASVSIFPENHGDRNSSTMTAQRLETYSQRIRRSPEFQRFKTDYTKKVSFMKENINNFIVNDEDLNVDQLLDETLTLFGENSTTISMFDMLHNMRQIDDSTYAHSVNVALICRLIGKWKNFSEKDMDTLTLCGLLHIFWIKLCQSLFFKYCDHFKRAQPISVTAVGCHGIVDICNGYDGCEIINLAAGKS